MEKTEHAVTVSPVFHPTLPNRKKKQQHLTFSADIVASNGLS